MTRVCKKCGEEKDSSLFRKNKVVKGGYQYICKECHNKHTKEYNIKTGRVKMTLKDWHKYKHENRIIRSSQLYRTNKNLLLDGLRLCKCCLHQKLLCEFKSDNKNGKVYYHSICKECSNIKRRNRKIEHKTTKVCIKCKIEKPLDRFSTNHKQCKRCVADATIEYRDKTGRIKHPGQYRTNKDLKMINRKKCSICGKVKPIELFQKHNHCRDGHTSQCVSCVKLNKGRGILLQKDKIYCTKCKTVKSIYDFDNEKSMFCNKCKVEEAKKRLYEARYSYKRKKLTSEIESLINNSRELQDSYEYSNIDYSRIVSIKI